MPTEHNVDPMQRLSMKQVAATLEQALKILPKNEQLVMSLHYQDELPFKDIATVLNLTPGRVSQIHSQAMVRIRVHLSKSSHELL